MSEKTVYIVQIVREGLPEDPEVFAQRPDAIDRYRKLAKERMDIDGAGIGDMTEDEVFNAVQSRSDDEAADCDLFFYSEEVQ